MKLWLVTLGSRSGNYVTTHVVRAATSEDAIALACPWPNMESTAEPITEDGPAEVVLSDDR